MQDCADRLEKILTTISEISPFYVAISPPKPYSGSEIRAIFLGADPGTTNDRRFKYVFSLEDGENSLYFRQFLPNLHAVRLSVKNLYVQNLCQNYFKGDTQRRRGDWLRCASHWCAYLCEELDSLDPQRHLAVLVSAYVILEALSFKKCEPPRFYYENNKFIRKNQNRLYRTLIPFFRGGRATYRLDNPEWADYAGKIARHVAQNFA